MKLKIIRYICFLVFVFTLCSLIGCTALVDETNNSVSKDVVSNYTIQTNELLNPGRRTYRIISYKTLTEEQCKSIYKDINPSEDDITLWFYSSKEAVADGAYDVAMLETTDKGKSIKVTIK